LKLNVFGWGHGGPFQNRTTKKPQGSVWLWAMGEAGEGYWVTCQRRLSWTCWWNLAARLRCPLSA